MGPKTRIEAALTAAVKLSQASSAPQKLAHALDFALFPGGARIRPTILLSVALACGDDRPDISDAAAAGLELIHCASLIHDDLPCFDDADLRRGKPTVHKEFSEPLAVLAGDSLIVLAFEILARQKHNDPLRAINLVEILAKQTGMPNGICAGQGWESEAGLIWPLITEAKLEHYSLQRRKWAQWLRAKRPSLGMSLARGLAKPSRLPMICAMCFATPRYWANPQAKMICMAARTRLQSWVLRALQNA